MKMYFLLVTLWVPIGDVGQGYEQETFWAMDTGMTYAECIKLKEEATPYIEMMGGELECEVDYAS